MPQTTNFFGLVSGQARLEYTTTGGSSGYIDASGEIVSITLPDNERMVGTAHTIDGDMALLAVGKIAPGTMRIRGVYTGASGFWQDALSAYQNGTPLYFRFYPAGSAAGRYRWTSGTNGAGSAAPSAAGGACYVQQRPVPAIDAGEGQVYTYEISVMCPGFTGATI